MSGILSLLFLLGHGFLCRDFSGYHVQSDEEKTFVCRGCLNPVTGTGCTSVDIGLNASLELVDKFYYLGDMLSVDRDADAAVETRIRTGWNKFRQLVPLLTNKISH